MMKRMSIEEARRELGRLLDQVRRTGEPVFLTRYGSGGAVLLSAEEFERLKAIEEAYAQLAFERALEAIGNTATAAKLSPEVVEEAIRAVREVQDIHPCPLS